MARSNWETYMARDLHSFRAWHAAPAGKPRGAIVLLQEIYGVNGHIRSLADGLAAEGYLIIAPSLFDRVERHAELDYSPEHSSLGRGYMLQIKPEEAHADISACINVARLSGKVALLGFCWGGLLAFTEAHDSEVDAAVIYYGTRLTTRLERPPHCPTLLHFAARDQHVPAEDVEKLRLAFPHAQMHVYDAEHGFNCDQRAAYDAPSAALARERTLAFLALHVG